MHIIDGRSYNGLVRAARRLLRLGNEALATEVARVALDLTQHGATEVLHVSPSGLSLGDRIRIRTRHQRIPKDTAGNVVGFAKGKVLGLFFPPTMPNGVLVLVDEDDISLLSKPAVIGPWALTDEQQSPDAQGPGKPSDAVPGGSNLPGPAPLLPGPTVQPPPSAPKHTAAKKRSHA